MMAQLAPTSQIGTKTEFKMKDRHANGANRARRAGDGRPGLLIRDQLLRAILAALVLDRFHIISARYVPWSSATFEGARHIWTFVINAEAERRVEHFCATAAEDEWPLQGAFVADLVATRTEGQLIVEVLTVLER